MGLLRRWWIYIAEVYPLPSRLLASTALYLGVQAAFQATLDVRPLCLNSDALPAIATLVLILLHYRVSDEFKDADTDRRFFPSRPVPSGRVSLVDLKWLLGAIYVALFGIHLVWNLVWVPFLVLLVFTALMHKWFFCEKTISNNRLLAFITHSPITFLCNAFAIAVYVARYPVDPYTLKTAAVMIYFAMPGLAWEFARKTRTPAEEVAGYQTYSAMLGTKLCVVVALSFVAIQLGCIAWLPMSTPYCVILAVASVMLAAWFGRFLRYPERGSASLRPAMELWGLVSTGGWIVDLVVARGVQWQPLA